MVAFAGWGIFATDNLKTVADAGLSFVTKCLGWAFIVAGEGFELFALVLACSRYGRIRLGTDDERPKFTTSSWFVMMFAAGMGIGLVFFGAAEPLSHSTAPPMGLAEPGSDQAAQRAMHSTIFHWGLLLTGRSTHLPSSSPSLVRQPRSAKMHCRSIAISTVSGVGKGVKIVSNINMRLAGVLALFMLILGPPYSSSTPSSK